MQLRNIGILGYAVVFPLATGLLALLFHRCDTARQFLVPMQRPLPSATPDSLLAAPPLRPYAPTVRSDN
ncbi:hypothetical protein GCM10009767_07830 [Kocuria aegyptia]|uniref:Uncharacterized protein n=1 Tax=Kocuria aegyptia TaxID=330943 RepID=A0ABP4WCC1_9MICC